MTDSLASHHRLEQGNVVAEPLDLLISQGPQGEAMGGVVVDH
jgi:hypothetical protein